MHVSNAYFSRTIVVTAMVLPLGTVSYCIIACSATPEFKRKVPSMSENYASTEPAELIATFPNKLIQGGRWPLKVTLRNTSPKPLIVPFPLVEGTDVHISVRDALGNTASRTEFGERYLPGGARHVVVSTILEELAPGETFTLWPEIDLGKCFQFRPGKYNVELSATVELPDPTRDAPGPSKEVRCELQITVEAPPK